MTTVDAILTTMAAACFLGSIIVLSALRASKLSACAPDDRCNADPSDNSSSDSNPRNNPPRRFHSFRANGTQAGFLLILGGTFHRVK